MRRVAIIGTGMLGTSVGLALGRVPTIERVIGYDRDPAQLFVARQRAAVDTTVDSLGLAVRDADLVVLAVPVSAVRTVMLAMAPYVRPGTILTDVASVKRTVVDTMQRLAPAGAKVIGGHPMAGSHERGAAAGRPDLLAGATYVLTPTELTDTVAYGSLNRLLTAAGAQVIALSPQVHDDVVGVISHLPQLCASTLMNLAAEHGRSHGAVLQLAAGGFGDVTRIAGSDPQMWIDICRENRDVIIPILTDYAARIDGLRQLLDQENSDALESQLVLAHEARRTLPGRLTDDREATTVVVDTPAQIGVLADVTTVVGGRGIHIHDVGVHRPYLGREQLHLTIPGRADALSAARALQAMGYRANVDMPSMPQMQMTTA